MQQPALPYPCVAWVYGFLFSPSNQLRYYCSRVAVRGCFLFSTIGGWHILILFTNKSRLFLCRSVSLFDKLGCLFACNIVMLSVPLACTNPRNKTNEYRTMIRNTPPKQAAPSYQNVHHRCTRRTRPKATRQ